MGRTERPPFGSSKEEAWNAPMVGERKRNPAQTCALDEIAPWERG